ncbi:MAG: hypothetical protein H6811_01350 [Phycisphaeraceae bacterium]|nr:hypothetical protein [Phycisphaeraceae bacterium]
MFDRLVPSMFHRRLTLLLSGFLALLAAMAVRVADLTLHHGVEYRREAERRLVRESWTPTVRGRILDRRGRVLAETRASYAIAVSYEVLSGRWARDRAAEYAKRRYAGAWRELGDDDRERIIRAIVPIYDAHVEASLDLIAQRTGTPRALLDERRADILSAIAASREHLFQVRMEKARAEARERGRELSEQEVGRLERKAGEDIAEQNQAHVLVRGVADIIAFDLDRLAAEWGAPAGIPEGVAPEPVERLPGLEVQDTEDRAYPFETINVEVDRSTLPGPLRDNASQWVTVRGVATHVLGWMRRAVRREDIEARAAHIDPDAGTDRGQYMPGDMVGHVGIESSHEFELRGRRGLRTSHLDTGEQTHRPSEPGHDLRLTIDAMLQARIQAVMSPELGLAQVQPWQGDVTELVPVGTPVNGAAVVLDIESGDILAMVSTPSFTREQLETDADSIFSDRSELPWLNRPIQAAYPPGSIAKALVLAHAVDTGVFSLAEHIDCTGHLLPGKPDQLRCWIFKQNPGVTHTMTLGHPLSAVEGLTVSCNVFFFTLGQRLGPQRIAEMYRLFGIGETFDLGLGAESPGLLGIAGNPASIDQFDAVQMGIGQGPVAWSPLHAANAISILARDGARRPPHLVLGQAATPGPPVRLAPGVREAVLDGLAGVVRDPRNGTAHHITFPDDGRREPIFNVPERISLWGKTGTATAPLQFDDANDNGRRDAAERIIRQGDHSWFVLLAGVDRPQYAIAVLMEYAGSGARVSGPIANQIVHALIAEGYLPRADG